MASERDTISEDIAEQKEEDLDTNEVIEKEENVTEQKEEDPGKSGVSDKEESVAEQKEEDPDTSEVRGIAESVAEQNEEDPGTNEVGSREENVAEQKEEDLDMSGVSEREEDVEERKEGAFDANEVSRQEETVTEQKEKDPNASGASGREDVTEQKTEDPETNEVCEEEENVAEQKKEDFDSNVVSGETENVAEQKEEDPVPSQTQGKEENVAEQKEEDPGASRVSGKEENVVEQKEKGPGQTEVSGKEENVVEQKKEDHDTSGVSGREENVVELKEEDFGSNVMSGWEENFVERKQEDPTGACEREGGSYSVPTVLVHVRDTVPEDIAEQKKEVPETNGASRKEGSAAEQKEEGFNASEVRGKEATVVEQRHEYISSDVMSQKPENVMGQKKVNFDTTVVGGKEDNVATQKEDFNANKKREKGGFDVVAFQKNLAVAGVVVLLFGLLVLSMAFGASMSAATVDNIDKVKQTFCGKIRACSKSRTLEGSGLKKIPQVIDINFCRKKSQCKFDVSSCDEACPLGFETKKDCPVSCECAKKGVTQLDIQFDENTLPALIEQMDLNTTEDFEVFSKNSGIQLWKQFVVDGKVKIPYEIDEAIEDSRVKATITEAFETFHKFTCISFKKRDTEEDYIYIQMGNGDCSASYARRSGRNNLNVASCYSSGHVLHVLMHLLGFHHQHMRYDRDAYIEIVWDNVDPVYTGVFNKLNPEKYLASEVDFDTESIMMPNGYAFSKSMAERINPTMLDLDNNKTVVGGGSTFTKKDLESIAAVYCSQVPENDLARQVQFSLLRSDDVSSITDEVQLELRWTPWTTWSRCQASCGYSIKTRRRKCQMYGFQTPGCQGEPMQVKSCRRRPCVTSDLSGKWGKWGPWSKCSSSCGKGIRRKKRRCSKPGQCRGKGPNTRMRKCYAKKCSIDVPRYNHWSTWSKCDRTCGQAERTRRRECVHADNTRSRSCHGLNPGENGFDVEHQTCLNPDCQDTLNWKAMRRSSSVNQFALPEDFSKLDYHEAFDQSAMIIDTQLCDPLPNNHWFTGDFNGDGRTDTMCGENIALMKLFLTNPDGTLNLRWTGRLSCNIDHVFIGDFNGDGTDDVFCKDDLLVRNLIYTSGRDGLFYDFIEAGPFCMNAFDKIQVIDVDGDGRSDLLCKHPETNEDTDIYISSLNVNG